MAPQEENQKETSQKEGFIFDKIKDYHSKSTFLSEEDLKLHIKEIRTVIRAEEQKIRKEYTWLEHQNAIGMGLFLISLISVFITGYLYVKQEINALTTIFLMAISYSILHELEHDLIHNMYFKGQQWVQHIMFFFIWVSKWSTNPWFRKILHLRHHILSGQVEDIEERLIGLGLPLNLSRILITFYPMTTSILFPILAKDNKKAFARVYSVIINIPTAVPMAISLHLFLGYIRLFYGLTFTQYDPVLNLPLWLWPYVRNILVIVILPNIIRQTSLNLLASYSHYYGDIPKHNPYYQNQILNHWILYPLQVFCFNFGATHIIHHFVANQPFYLRQWLAPRATEELIKHGIRLNDFEIVKRDNRYFERIN